MVVMPRRPALLPSTALLIGGVPLLVVLAIRSGTWWVVGTAGVLFGLRLLTWLAAPYSRLAFKAIEPRYETPEELAETLEPFQRFRVIGPILRFGAKTMGVQTKRPERERDDRRKSS